MLRSSKRLKKQKCMCCDVIHSVYPWPQVDINIF